MPHARGQGSAVAVALASWIPIIVLAGCSHAVPLKPTLDPPPGVSLAPVAVGVYYSPEFRRDERQIHRAGDRWDFAVGDASVRLLDRAWPALFETAVPVPNRPPLAPDIKVAAVIEPKIEAFDFPLPFLKTGNYTAEITYRMTLYSPDGESLVSWTVRGAAAKAGQVGFEFARWPGEAVDLAMQDAVTKMIVGFRDVPEVRSWLRRVGDRNAWWVSRWLRAVSTRE